MNGLEHIKLWNHKPVKVMDIRHSVLMQQETLKSYQLPSSAFLFAARGEALIMLDGIEH